jgi:carbon-monoxide dehydrogenase large subunit
MNSIAEISPERFAVGQSVPRSEDPALLRGEGRYTDDLNLPGQVFGVVVRSRTAHGVLRGVDSATALAMPGVLAVLTGADLEAAGLGPMPITVFGENRDKSPYPRPRQMALATDRVRYVGDPVAFVVAETVTQAKDAAEAVLLDIDELLSVTDARAADVAGAPQLYDEAPGNLLLDWHFGDTDAVGAAFARAAHITRLDIRNTRIVVCQMEPRAALAEWDDEDGRYVLRVGCQGVVNMRGLLAGPLAVPADKIRVLTGHVGGSFGMKYTCYPEYVCALHAAKLLGRPVKWTDERTDGFLSDSHGRDHDITAELALDADGNFLAVRVTGYANVGARLSNALTLPGTMNVARNIVGAYRTPLVEASVRCLFTNTTPVGAYRGAGRPEGNYYIERLIETAAREIGISAVELRRRNHIRPEQLPYTSPAGAVFDSGDFPALLDHTLKLADWDGYAARAAESAARGKVRGRGIGQFMEMTAPASPEHGGVRFEADGTVSIVTGTLDYGQGHAGTFAQVLAAALGVPYGAIRLVQGDSDQLLAGGGTGGSRSIMQSGAAILAASDAVIEKGKRIAAHLLEAAEADIAFAAGRFAIVGTDRGIGIMDLAARLRAGVALPEGVPTSLDAALVNAGVAAAFPNGCHVAEVELDPETGVIGVVRYAMVNDFGIEVNPMVVAGQAHGGVVQGIGQALGEAMFYDETGQLVSGSFMDYAVPRATDAPSFVVASHPTPALTNPLGVKGCGEAGCAGSLPAVMNAVVDAMSRYGITHFNMPATPERVWAAISARL